MYGTFTFKDMGLYDSDRYQRVNLLAIDPGLHLLGVSVHVLNSRSGAYEKVYIESINVDRTFRRRLTDDSYRSEQDSCLLKIYDHIYDVCRHYDISFLAHEEPFNNPMRPGAYGPLKSTTATVRHAAMAACPSILIDAMSPQNIKKGVGAGGTKGKEIMREKVLAIPELMNVLECHPDDLTEDCIDSLAIGYNARNTLLAPMEGWRIK